MYLDVGVEDDRAVLALRRIQFEARQTEQAFIGVAQSAKLAGGMGNLVSVNTRVAQSYRSVTIAATQAATGIQRASIASRLYAAATTAPPVGWSVGTPTGTLPAGMSVLARQSYERAMGSMTTPWSAASFMGGVRAPAGRGPYMPGYNTAGRGRGGRGNFGLGTSIFLATAGLGAGAYAYGQSANLQRASQLSAFASGQSAAAMRAQSLALTGDYRMRLRSATALTQEVSQLGALTPEGQRELARAGAGFNVLESQVAAGDAARSIYQLIKATSRSKEELDRGTAAATRYAGAIYAAGNESAAGAASVFAMTQEIQPLAQFMNIGANGTIALAAAFADLNENQRELFRGALTRMATEGKIDPNNPISSLIAIAERLREAGSDAEKVNILKSLGFDNIRDIQTLAVMAASMDTFGRSLEVVNEELVGTSKFGSHIQKVLGDQQGAWDALKGSMDRASASIVNGVAPALMLLMSVLTGVGDTISANPALGVLLGIGAGGLAYMGLRGAWRRHMARDAGTRMAELGLTGPQGARRHGRLAENLLMTLPFLGRSRAERMTTTRFGVALAEGAGMGRGLGRMNRLSLGLMRAMPFGEGLAVRAAGTMAAGGMGGTALRVATGPIGWVVTALMLGAPLFERIADAAGRMAAKGGMLGVTLNTVALIFDVLAAGGRILNEAFDWLAKGGKWLLDAVTFGHGDEMLGGMNKGLSNARDAVQGIARDESKAGPQTPPKAPVAVANIYTGGSQSGFQTAMDEVSRRAARAIPSNTYGGIPV